MVALIDVVLNTLFNIIRELHRYIIIYSFPKTPFRVVVDDNFSIAFSLVVLYHCARMSDYRY